MCLARRARRATKNVDAWFAPAPEDHEAVRAVAADHDLRLGLKSAAAVLEVVLAFFPPERLPVRPQLLLEEMFDDRG